MYISFRLCVNINHQASLIESSSKRKREHGVEVPKSVDRADAVHFFIFGGEGVREGGGARGTKGVPDGVRGPMCEGTDGQG